MRNHVHLVAVPSSEHSLGLALRDAHNMYARQFNAKYKFTGHLWQGRYFSAALDEPHLWAAVRYVERNPVRARIVKRAEDYQWSSAPAHCDRRKKDELLGDGLPVNEISDWREFLKTENSDEAKRVRSSTRTGRPCGSASFLEKLESLVGRRLRPDKRGRKPKKK
jgi:putative transposase